MRKSRDELLKLLQNFVDENNDDIHFEFGDWNNALKNIDVDIGKEYFRDEDIIHSLRNFYLKHGKISSNFYRIKRGRPGITVITKRYGSWNNALQVAGLPSRVSYKTGFTEEELQLTLKESYRIIGDPFTSKAYEKWAKENKKPSFSTVVTRFGNWGNAIKSVDIKVQYKN